MKKSSIPAGIEPDAISSLFYPYVAINSETGTAKENAAAGFVISSFQKLPYFIAHPGQLALEPVPGDHLQRSIAWALVKGTSSRTVVLIHHLDVVEIEDFKLYKNLAFDPEALGKALIADPSGLDADTQADLASGLWIFGRGSADMKAGGAIQLAVLAACAGVDELKGNLLLLAVPDEEHLSAGMRAASALMGSLGRVHSLDYVLMINSEPHQRKLPEKGLLSGGSIGKLLPFVYVRGILAHAGKSYEGFNPISILGEITSHSEMCSALVDIDEASGELSPPPTWLMARDGKAVYDVSMPLSAFGCLSVLPLHSSPKKIIDFLLALSSECTARVAHRVNEAIDAFRIATGRIGDGHPWRPMVQDFADFLAAAKQAYPGRFELFYQEALCEIRRKLREGEISHTSATRDLVDAIFQFTGTDQPVVIVGLVPPYYPSVSYRDRPDFESMITELATRLDHFSRVRFGQELELEAYFTGISDLSYSSLGAGARDLEAFIARQMPLYGNDYSIPFVDIEQSAMPCINIGPWGKDFHKLSERVLRDDLLERTPALLLHAIDLALRPALAPRP